MTGKECKKLYVEGAPGYVLNLISRSGVKVIKPRINEKGCTFTVSDKNYLKTCKLLKTNRRKFKLECERGVLTSIVIILKNFGIWAGVVASLVSIFIYFHLITSIEVKGNSIVDKNTVLEVVDDKIKTPLFYFSEDFKGLDDEVEKIDGIAYATTRKEGRRIVINIVEELPEVATIDTQNPKSIIAPEDGVIMKIVVYGGTSAVGVGEQVVKGQELIYPYLESTEGERLKSVAMGKIEIKTTRVEEIEYQDESAFNSSSAKDVERSIQNFKLSLKEGEVYLGSRFLVKNVDKKVVVSIYYEVITRVA
ncbi:MAG: sporulation protein YqfD [Clostridia bacterium]|nr:sporulation protein YqfD [Clostridia bacterium]